MSRRSARYKSCFWGLFCLLPGLVFVPACQEPVEGCLDIRATNFDPRADRDCCCQYPNLVLDLRYRAGGENFQLNTDFTLEDGQVVQFRKAAFYVSGIGLYSGSEFFLPQDTVYVFRDAGGVRDSAAITGNAFIVNRSGFSIAAGTFTTEGSFDRLRLVAGLEEQFLQNNITLTPPGNVLALQADSLHTLGPAGYLHARITYYLPGADIERTIEIDAAAFDGVEVLLPISLESVTGADRRVVLEVDYLELFRGLDLLDDDDAALRAGTWANVRSMFRVP